MVDYWQNRGVVITGGASFIGSHIVEKLVDLGANVTIIDNFSSGTIANIANFRDRVRVEKFDIESDPREELALILKEKDVVFHLAARHGGRGYIDTHPADVCNNMAIDNIVLNACLKADVNRVVMASSACVYPPKLQEKSSDYLLLENDTDITKLDEYLSADIEYGWAKVMGEMQLRAFNKQYGLSGSSLRFVTAYGPKENETHAIIALIYKALNHQDPFEIWGDGQQDRDFTYVKDIASACVLAAESITNKVDEFNIGTGKRYTIDSVAEIIFSITGWRPKRVHHNTDKPTGVYSRALNISKISKTLGWKPSYSLFDGLRETIDWYRKFGSLEGISENRLMERVDSNRLAT